MTEEKKVFKTAKNLGGMPEESAGNTDEAGTVPLVQERMKVYEEQIAPIVGQLRTICHNLGYPMLLDIEISKPDERRYKRPDGQEAEGIMRVTLADLVPDMYEGKAKANLPHRLAMAALNPIARDGEVLDSSRAIIQHMRDYCDHLTRKDRIADVIEAVLKGKDGEPDLDKLLLLMALAKAANKKAD